MDCLFCKIVEGEIPSEKVYEDEMVYAFRDIDPQAPTHILVIPKRHIQSVDELEESDGALLGMIFATIKRIAAAEGLEDGYRVVSNIKEAGGQTVPHLHFHILGGRSMHWPPG